QDVLIEHLRQLIRGNRNLCPLNTDLERRRAVEDRQSVAGRGQQFAVEVKDTHRHVAREAVEDVMHLAFDGWRALSLCSQTDADQENLQTCQNCHKGRVFHASTRCRKKRKRWLLMQYAKVKRQMRHVCSRLPSLRCLLFRISKEHPRH